MRLAIAVGVVGLALDFDAIAGTMVVGPQNPVARPLGNMLVYYWTFLTNLSNLALILTYLSVLTGWEATCIEWSRGRGVDALALRPARSLPLYAGAAGRMLLASAVDDEDYLARAPFEPLTPGSIVDAEALRRDIERTRAQGYVWSQGDVTYGIDAVGVAVRGRRGTVVGCLSLGGLSEAFTGRVEEFVGELQSAAAELGGSIG